MLGGFSTVEQQPNHRLLRQAECSRFGFTARRLSGLAAMHNGLVQLEEKGAAVRKLWLLSE